MANIPEDSKADAARLRDLFKARTKLSQAAFGKQYGLGSQGMVWQYLSGSTPLNIPAAKKFAEGLGVSIDSFSPTLARQIEEASALTERPIDASSNDEFVMVRRVDVKLSAGHGAFVYSEDDLSRLAFRADFLRTVGAGPENSVSVTVDGSSMEPTIPDGSTVLINMRAKSILPGKIYAFRLDGQLLIKRLYHDSRGTVTARSDNPEFDDLRISDDCADFEILGRAFWMGAKLH
ncbi:Peptidase S24-like [Achromobacter xylosoxidans]|jgi:phage repressor protein C with HTH and peptisase S24 domain|uniref:LexA family transcriptional regulator n=2 Tax=Alcaligenes xylosoxydans xylosoxydans TaxID=85698 RepID=UPI0006C14960|nr:LexA family transcriptional regulator [Achromobacter xylosoxidans]CUK13125.1 Peptidase S24-like [Achromobacter xylosoxidans]